MRRLAFILLALTFCVSAFGQAFTPRRPFVYTTPVIGESINLLDGLTYYWGCETTNSPEMVEGLATNAMAGVNWTVLITNGIYGSGFQFDGGNLHYAAPKSYLTFTLGRIFTNSWTISIWANIPQFALLKFITGFVNPGDDTWILSEYFAEQGLTTSFITTVPTEYTVSLVPRVAMTNVWRHFCIGYDNVNKQGWAQLDWESRGTVYTTNALRWSANNVFGVAGVPTLTSPYFYAGKIDEIGLWNRSLTTNEVWALSYSFYTGTNFVQSNAAPVVMLQPVSVACLTNTIQSFAIIASGNPQPSYQWRTNGVALADTIKWNGATRKTLWVTNDGILYTNLQIDCVITNTEGSVTSSVASLDVLDNLITNGLVVWWKFNDGSGTNAADSTGNGNTGTLYGTPVWTNGVYNGALLLNGTNQWVVKSNATLVPTGNSARTYSAWVKPLLLYDGYAGYYLTTGFPNSGTSFLCGYRNSSLATGWQLSTAGAPNDLKSATVYAYNTWWMVTCTYSAGIESIYVNASYVTNKNITTTATSDSNTYVGKHAAGEFFKGYIDEARIYDRVLSTNDMNLLYRLQGL